MINLTATKKGLILVLLPLVFQIAFISLLAGLIASAQSFSAALEDSRETILQIHDIEQECFESIALILDAEAHPERSYVGEFTRLEQLMRNAVKELKSKRPLRDDVQQIIQAVVEASPRLEKLCRTGRKIYGDPSKKPEDRIKYIRNDLYAVGFQFREIDRQIFDLEKMVQADEPVERRRRLLIIGIVVAGLFGSLLFCALLSAFFTKEFVARLKVIDQNARFIAMRRELPPVIPGQDEIADLDRVLHDSSIILNELQDQENAFLDSAADVIVSLDEKGKFQTVGFAANRVWGYSGDDLLGTSMVSILTPESVERTRSAIALAVGSEHEQEVENVVKCRNSQMKDTLWTLAWSPADRSLQCVAHDITDRRELERLKQRFVAIASHDLRAPLHSLASTLSLLSSRARGELSDAVLRDIAKIEAGVDRLRDLVNDLLDLEKLEAGKMVLQLGAVSALDACSAAIESLEAMSAGAGITIVKPTNDALLNGDERRLVQVLVNLISNAIKFSGRGSTITVSITGAGETVDMVVCDQGQGIPDEDREAVFEKFKQSRAKSDKGFKNTGLGLAIVKAIVDAHHGRVFVEDNRPKGSKFVVRIPAYTGA